MVARLITTICCCAPILQALRHLGQKHPTHATPLKQRQQLIKRGQRKGIQAVAAKIGNFPGCLVGCHAFCEAAQALNQHNPQRGGQCPHFAERQFTRFLVGVQKLYQQVLVEGTVGVCNKSPGHAVHPWQTRQWLVHQHRQRAKITVRQTFVNFLELRLNQVKVVKQPFCSRAYVVTGRSMDANVRVCLTQNPDIVLKAGEKRCGT